MLPYSDSTFTHRDNISLRVHVVYTYMYTWLPPLFHKLSQTANISVVVQPLTPRIAGRGGSGSSTCISIQPYAVHIVIYTCSQTVMSRDERSLGRFDTASLKLPGPVVFAIYTSTVYHIYIGFGGS